LIFNLSPFTSNLLMKQPPQEIRIGLDPGSSLTKVVYALGDTLQYFWMEPEVLTLPIAPIDQGTVALCTDPEHQAWLQLPQDQQFYAVGQLAHQFKAIARLDKLKYEQALYKVLAAIGAIVQREQISGRFTVKLATVLPYTEYRNRAQLNQQVATALKGFEFRGQKMKGAIDGFFCSPEGGGHAWRLIQQHGESWFKKRVVVILMLGHRDISCLTFSNGVVNPNHSKTTALGFSELLKRIIHRTAGLDEAIAPTIFQIGSEYQPNSSLVRSLVRSTQQENIVREAEEVCEAIRVARLEYESLIKNWLDITLPKRLETLVIGGGASFYLKDELTRFLGWADPLWSEPLDMDTADEKLLSHRMADIGFLFHSCLAQHLQAV
jgi:hypothetical protein